MRYLALLLCFTSSVSIAISITPEDPEYLNKCEALLEEILKTECGKETLGFLKHAYLKIGLEASKRHMDFIKKSSGDSVFSLTGDWTPSPIITFSLGDSYFTGTNLGYQLNLDFFIDTADKQVISRGSKSREVDLNTYSKITVLTFSPTLLYSFGHNQEKTLNAFTLGLGLNAGYSRVKGTALLTDFEPDTTCYDTGTQYVNSSVPRSSLMLNCAFAAYDSEDFSYGAQFILSYEYRGWLTELSQHIYAQDIKGDYTFETKNLRFSVSRKFGI